MYHDHYHYHGTPFQERLIMPRRGDVLQIYLSDEEEKRRIKEIAEKLGVSVSSLVRNFFRSLAENRQNIIITEGIVSFVELKINEILSIINQALKSNNKLIMNNSLIQIRQALKQLIADLKNFSSK